MRVNPGEKAPVTGRYRHTSGCGNTIIVNKGEIMPPCGLPSCPHRGGAWQLIQTLT